MSSTPVFDVSSYLASLQGDLLTLQNNLSTTTQARDTAQTNATNANNQLQTLSQQYYSTPLGEQGVSSDQLNTLHGLGNQVNSYQSTVDSSNAQISSLNTQISALKDQITAATTQVNRSLSITDTIRTTNRTTSSPGINLGNITSTISKLSPLVLLAGAGLILLILK